MAEGIKSLATTAGYFAPGAGILDALGMYPDENSQSLLANLKAGEFGSAGLQGLGALGDALLFTGVGAPLGMTLKTVSKGGKALGRVGKQKIFHTNRAADEILTKKEPLTLTNKIKVQGEEIPLDKARLEYLTPKILGEGKDHAKYSARALEDYAIKNRSIAGRSFKEGGKDRSKYFYFEKNVGLGSDNPAKIGVRISDHAPTARGPSTRGGPEWINADVKINVGPKGQIDKVGNAVNSTTLEGAIEMIENMHIKPGFAEDIVRNNTRVGRKHLQTARVVDGKVVASKTPYDIYRAGGQLPFGMDVSRL